MHIISSQWNGYIVSCAGRQSMRTHSLTSTRYADYIVHTDADIVARLCETERARSWPTTLIGENKLTHTQTRTHLCIFRSCTKPKEGETETHRQSTRELSPNAYANHTQNTIRLWTRVCKWSHRHHRVGWATLERMVGCILRLLWALVACTRIRWSAVRACT